MFLLNFVKPNILTPKIFRCASTLSGDVLENKDIVIELVNRNPRNLERLRLARKPQGYHLDKKFVQFWHKVEICETRRNITAKLVHNSGDCVVSVSTGEYAVRQFLYSRRDRSAFRNVARIFAERCLETGITHMASDIKAKPGSNVDDFLKVLEEEGITLKEPQQYSIHDIWKQKAEAKPWLISDS